MLFEALESRQFLSGDVSGDGFADVVWRNTKTNSVVAWPIVNGAFVAPGKSLPALPSLEWEVLDIADYTGDFHGDVISYNKVTGAMRANVLIAGTPFAVLDMPAEADINWQPRAIADFDFDGEVDDIVYRNVSTGENRLRIMDNTTNTVQATLTLKSEADFHWTIVASGDWDNTGNANITWWNRVTGAMRYWVVNTSTGAFISETILPNIADPFFVPFTSGDFDQDGNDDLAFHNRVTGENRFQLMKPGTNPTYKNFGTLAPKEWQAGFEDRQFGQDFNKDNSTDLLWRNSTTGQFVVWYMKGTALQTAQPVFNLPIVWEPAATADFNADGKTDLLWRNSSTGQTVIWLMNGVALSQAKGLPVLDPLWKAVAAADMTGDAAPDIIFRHANTGQVVVWTVVNSAFVASTNVATVANPWSIVGAGDFNLDGKNDLLWRNTSSGQVTVWNMNNTTFLNSVALKNEPDLNWKIEGVADVDRDGNLDIVWRNSATGAGRFWKMKKSIYVASVNYGTLGVLDWKMVI